MSATEPGPATVASTATARAPATPLVVLVAEDEESVRSMVALALRSRGFDTLLCADGQEAIDRLDAGDRVDAVLMDIRMPRMDGIGLVSHIRARPDLDRLPVIAMSAYNDDRQEREVLAAGANAFLAKPFSVSELGRMLAAYVRGPRRGDSE